jgi:hypothetical protein
VRGRATAELPDLVNEIFDWDTGKPQVEKWRDACLKRSAGKSLGNIRAMHGGHTVAAGIATSIVFDDVNKSVELESHIIDLNEARKCIEGVNTGYSIGGGYLKRWADPVIKGAMRYTPSLNEISLVDSPCLESATFDYVKSDGTGELRKFVTPAAGVLSDADVVRLAKAVAALAKDAKTKRVGGEDLGASDFAYVGDPDDTSTWKLPVHDAAHAKDALSRFSQTEGIPAADKSKVARRLVSAAKKHGIDAEGFAEEHAKAAFSRALAKRARLGKGMWDVGTLAQIMCQLAYMEDSLTYEADFEGDASIIPAQLREALVNLKQIFLDLAAEEVSELVGEESAAAAKAAQAQIQKEVGSMLTELKKAIALAGASTDPAMKKMEAHLTEIGKHVDKIAKAHEDMKPHIDALQGGEEEETPEAKKEKKEEAEKAAAASTLSKANDSRFASIEASIAKSNEVLSLIASRLVPTQVAAVAVAKTADVPGAPAAAATAATTADPVDQAIKAAHAAGMTRRIG